MQRAAPDGFDIREGGQVLLDAGVNGTKTPLLCFQFASCICFFGNCFFCANFPPSRCAPKRHDNIHVLKKNRYFVLRPVLHFSDSRAEAEASCLSEEDDEEEEIGAADKDEQMCSVACLGRLSPARALAAIDIKVRRCCSVGLCSVVVGVKRQERC